MSKIKLAFIPIGVLLISIFFVFGATFLLVLYAIKPEFAASAIAERNGLPSATGSWILPAIATIGLIIAYGLLSLSRWGFFLTITYLLYFVVINIYLFIAARAVIYCGNVSWSILVIGYLILVRKKFLGVVKA